MKKVFILLLLQISVISNAQKDVTMFLGIPVDGTKPEMRKKLIAKGFTYNSKNDCLDGEFNGRDVNVYIATNNNKVWRIMVADKNESSETDIKIRFNHLCNQFAKNSKYIKADIDNKEYNIPEDENISYEIIVNKKRYQATYYQLPNLEKLDTTSIFTKANKEIESKFTKEQINNPSEEQLQAINSILKQYAREEAVEIMIKKSVWFTIGEHFGKYFISIFYDNEFNHSDGEDL
jgi:hypothetical protein